MHIIVYSLSPIERYHGSWKLELVVWLGLLIEGREKKVCVAATTFNNIKRAIVINNTYFQLN